MSQRRYAVLVASSQFPAEPKLQPLRCPENDVEGLNEILTSKAYGEFNETILMKNRPHYEALLKIDQVLKRADKDDLVLLYYSGHGKLDPAGRLHLATVDTVIDSLEATSIPVSSIKNYVDVSHTAKIVLLLDCCFSGAVDKAFLRSGVDDQLNLASGGRGIYVMTASTGIQVAQEKESDKYGAFTKHIIEGIRSGDADIDGDGLINMSDLYRYVHDRMLDEGSQEPMKWDLNVRGELVIGRSGKTSREDRRKQLRAMLLDLSQKEIIPDSILSKALEVMRLEPARLSVRQQDYSILLDRLLQMNLTIGEFIDDWYRLEQMASIPVPSATQSPTPTPQAPLIEPRPITPKTPEAPPAAKPQVEYAPEFCLQCGKPLRRNSKFCLECGVPIKRQLH